MSEVPKHQPCFGRAADIARLAARMQQRGVTFVMAPPRMGKTWLVRNLAFQWAQHQGWNVGYAESSSGKNDLLREVVADLYRRWLGDSDVVAQARSLWERHRDGLVGKIGGAVGKLLNKIAGLVDGDLLGAQKVIDETLDALTRAEQDLRSGGLTLAPITYEDARDLVRTVGKVTDGKPILLVMDAWERGQTLAGDQGSIQKLLDNDQDWPAAFHLLVVIRDLPKHLEEVRFAKDCCGAHPSAERYTVAHLDLDDLEEQDRLLLFLGEKLPAISHAEREWVMQQCQNPAVIEWWIRRQPVDDEGLRAEAANAHNEQYLGLVQLIEYIRDQEALFNATVGLSLLPEITSAAMWRPYQALIDAEDADDVVADLQSRRILDPERPDFPSFGHTTAYDAVRAFLLRAPETRSEPDLRPHVRRLLKTLIADLAGRVRWATLEDMPFAAALANLGDTPTAVGLAQHWRWPAVLARLLFGQRLTTGERQELLTVRRVLEDELPSARVLLATGLFNTRNDAKAEDDLPRRDALLEELRTLARAYPEDAAVREQLAMGLFNTLFDAKAEDDLPRRDALLEELRALVEAHHKDKRLDPFRGFLDDM